MILLTDDYGLPVAHNRVPEDLRGLFSRQMDRIILPRDEKCWPGVAYIRKHRDE